MAITTVHNELIAENAISGTLIADNAITATHIATNAVSGTLIADNGITTVHIAQNNVTSTSIVANAITSTQLADNAVTATKIPDGTALTLGATTFTNTVDIRGFNGPVLTLGSSSTADPRIDFEDQNSTNHAGSLFYDQDADTIRLLRTVSGSAVDGIAIDASGEVGIGTATPSSLLHVKGTSAHTYLTIEANSGVGNAIKFIGANTWVVGNDTAGGTPDTAFSISDGNDERLTILSDGNSVFTLTS